MEEPKYKNGNIVYTFRDTIEAWTVTGVTPNKYGNYDYIVKQEGRTETIGSAQLFPSKIDIIRMLHAKAKVDIEKINKDPKLAGAGKKMQASAIKKQIGLFVAAAGKLP